MRDPERPDSHCYLYRFGSAEFDESKFELRVSGLRIEVENRALGVLLHLLRHADEVVTKEELLREVWAGRITVDKVLPNAIVKLRRALGESNAEQLITQARVGYRLVGPVLRTAVSNRIVSHLELAAGDTVPGRNHFVLRRQLGSRRDGEVWLAEQPRTHALRVFKFAGGGKPLRALKREATLLRVLHESAGNDAGFVELVDWNFEQPPFFLECGYGGENLLDWSREHLAAMPAHERITLFLQIIDAVATAHAVGVLHKDLKPANVLVSREREGWHVRLTDFGSGRLIDPARLDDLGITQFDLTITRSIVADSNSGTPLYLAPEAFSGQSPTAQADVFALGILLYQLLAGDLARPMTPGWERDIDDALLQEDIGAATDGDPHHRLASAAEFAARLRAGDTRREAARVAQVHEAEARRARMALARSRARRPYLVALLGTLLCGLLAVLLLYRSALDARYDAQSQLQRASAINRFLNEDLIGRSNPLVLAKGQNASLRDVLLAAHNRIGKRFAAQPLTEASIRSSLAALFGIIELLPEAEDEARRALALYRQQLGDDALDTLRARSLLARLLTRMSKFGESKAQIDALALAVGNSLDPKRTHLLAAARAAYALNQGDYGAAVPAYQQAIAALRSTEPGNTDLLDSLRMDLIGALTQTGRLQDARHEGESLITDIRTREESNGLLAAFTRALVARTWTLDGHLDKAEAQLLEAQGPIVRMLGGQHTRNLMILGDLYSVAMQRRDWPKAIDYGQRAYDGLRAKFGDDHNFTNISLANLGQAFYENGQTREAVPRLEQAYHRLVAQLSAVNPQSQATAYWLAAALVDAHALDTASRLIDGLDTKALESVQADGLWPLRIDVLRGLIHAQRGDLERAAPLLREGATRLAGHDASDSRLIEAAKVALGERN